MQNTDNVKKATAQLLGVSGREYKVYFYSTYINQISKNKNEQNKKNNQLNGTPNNKNNAKEENELNNSGKKRKTAKNSETSNGSDGSPDRKKTSIGKYNSKFSLKKFLKFNFYLKKKRFRKAMIGNQLIN